LAVLGVLEAIAPERLQDFVGVGDELLPFVLVEAGVWLAEELL